MIVIRLLVGVMLFFVVWGSIFAIFYFVIMGLIGLLKGGKRHG
jgi:hypothetical protein